MNLGMSLAYQFSHGGLSADITSSLSSPYKVVFTSINEPVLNGVTYNQLWSTDGFILLNAHKYMVTVMLELEYTGGTNIAATA